MGGEIENVTESCQNITLSWVSPNSWVLDYRPFSYSWWSNVSLALKVFLSSCRGPRLGSQHSRSGSQPSVTLALGDLIPPPSLWGQQTYMWCAYTSACTGRTLIHIKNKYDKMIFKRAVIWRKTRAPRRTQGLGSLNTRIFWNCPLPPQ